MLVPSKVMDLITPVVEPLNLPVPHSQPHNLVASIDHPRKYPLIVIVVVQNNHRTKRQFTNLKS